MKKLCLTKEKKKTLTKSLAEEYWLTLKQH